MYHEFGSRHLVDTLNSHGFCVSYTEVRRFLTSIANNEIEKIKNNSYIPNGITLINSGGYLVQEGADNIDLNTETIDGKDTFHSMAKVVFQVTTPNDTSANYGQIKRGSEKTLTLSESAVSMMSCLFFVKPKVRGEPPRIPDAYNKINSCANSQTNLLDIVWVFLRSLGRDIFDIPVEVPNNDSPLIPFWTGYNSWLSESRQEFNVVTYPPIIDSKPNDMATVFTTMKRCFDMCKAIGQEHGIQTFDRQLYGIAQQVKWEMPRPFCNHILCLGGFHTLSCYIAAVGKIWADDGLKDMLVDSSVYATGTVDHMLNGKQFNRAVRCLTLAYETLCALWLSAFFRWCKANKIFENIPEDVWTCFSKFALDFKTMTDINTAFDEVISLFNLHIMPLIEDFQNWGNQSSPTFKYWNMFLGAIEVLLQNIRSERDGLWSVHLSSSCSMLPYMFVTNRVNYSRWLPIYLLDMMNLPQAVNSAFEKGQFSVRQKPGKFNGVWCDMATEKTVIKDSKGCGGIVGITHRKSALIRWSLTRHILADFTSEMKTRSGCEQDKCIEHEETKPTALKRDEEQVNTLLNHVLEKMTDPFNIDLHPPGLINISTGMHAPKDIQTSLTAVVDEGEKMAKKFIDGALCEGHSRSFFLAQT